MHSILRADESLTTEELHQFWMERIDSGYIEMIAEAVENIKKSKKIEVRHPWNHPEKGWIYVRCSGFLDKSFKNGIRLKGYHHDVTEQIEIDYREDRIHKIIDLKKLKSYSPYFIETCEEFFEIDLNDLKIRTIFYRKDKYSQIEDDVSIFSLIREDVHPYDISTLEDVYIPESLNKIVNEGKIEKS